MLSKIIVIGVTVEVMVVWYELLDAAAKIFVSEVNMITVCTVYFEVLDVGRY